MSLLRIVAGFLLAASLTACDPGQEPPITEPPEAASAVAEAPPPEPAIDWLPPTPPPGPDEALFVFRLDDFSEDRLHATLGYCLDQLAFEGDDAEYQRGFTEGLWSGLLEEITYRQFILADHGIDFVAITDSPDETSESSENLQMFLRTTQPDAHAQAQFGLELIDSEDEFEDLLPLDAHWSRVVLSEPMSPAAKPESADLDEDTALNNEVDHALWDRLLRHLPSDASAYFVMSDLSEIFPTEESEALADITPEQSKALAEMTPEERDFWERLVSVWLSARMGAMTFRLGDRPAMTGVLAMPDVEVAIALAELWPEFIQRVQTKIDEDPTVDPAEAQLVLDNLRLLHVEQDQQFIVFSLEGENLEQLIASTDPGVWQSIPLMMVLLVDQVV
ncbi:MAG: hypothetical protein AAF911_09190 [Planctomycetota bacterium]